MSLALAVVLLAADADPAQVLREARAKYERLDYRSARDQLRNLLHRDLPKPMRINALGILGRAHAILGEDAEARSRFEELLAIEPGYTVRWWESQRVQEAFTAAGGAVLPRPGEEAGANPTRAGPAPGSGPPPGRVEPRRWGAEGATSPVSPSLGARGPGPGADLLEKEEDDRTLVWVLVGTLVAAVVGAAVTGVAVGLQESSRTTVDLRWELP